MNGNWKRPNHASGIAIGGHGVMDFRPSSGQVIGCDFDGRDRAAALLRLPDGEMRASINGELQPLPAAWNDICMIRWADASNVFVWPIGLRAEPHVGIVGPNGVSTAKVGMPLDIFSGQGRFLCTYAEDQIVGAVKDADLIATFEFPSLRKVARFVEPLLVNFPDVFFAEAEHGVLDQAVGDFWFVAYDTPFLWRYSVSSQRIAVGDLGCPLETIRAIACSDRQVTIICHDGTGLCLRSYKGTENSVYFEGQVGWTGREAEHIEEGILRQRGQLAGYHGNRIAVVTPTSAVLTALPI
jgi:hypothetical protein